MGWQGIILHLERCLAVEQPTLEPSLSLRPARSWLKIFLILALSIASLIVLYAAVDGISNLGADDY